MDYTRDEIKAGLMIMICTLILVIFMGLISGLDLLKSNTEYKVRLKHTGGVVIGSLVRYGGLEVGRVSGVNIAETDPTALEIRVEIDPKVPVTVDARAFLSSVGLLGDYYIEIMPGQPNSKRLPPGSYIPSVETTQFTQLTQPVEEISLKLQVLIERLSDLMNDQSRQHVASMIANLDCLLIRNAGHVDGILKNLQSTTANIQKISQNLDRLTSMEDSKIDQTWKNVNQTVADLQVLTQQLQQTAGHLNQMVVTNDQNLATLLLSIQETTDNLKDFTQQIKERPWNLIRKTEPKPRALPKE